MPIVLYNGARRWTVARNLREVISNSNILGENILDFKYELIDINRYNKDDLFKNRSISSAIFLLDQNINRIEFYDRLKNVVLTFNNLTIEEKAQLKHWLVNANLGENNYKENIEKIFNADKKEVVSVTSNISKGLEKLKEDSIKEGKAEMLIKQLNKKFNYIPNQYKEKIKVLPEKIIDNIAIDIFNIEKVEELEKYFKS